MHVTVRLGEPLWREVGARELTLDLPEASRVGDLLTHLSMAFPSLHPWLCGDEVPPMVFLDDALADPQTPLHDGARPMLTWALAGG